MRCHVICNYRNYLLVSYYKSWLLQCIHGMDLLGQPPQCLVTSGCKEPDTELALHKRHDFFSASSSLYFHIPFKFSQ